MLNERPIDPATATDPTTDPATITLARWIREEITPGEARQALMRRVLQRQVQTDPATAAMPAVHGELLDLMCEDPVVTLMFDRVYDEALKKC